MASTVFGAMDAAVMGPVQDFITQASNGVSTWLAAPFAAAFTLYILGYGLGILAGKISDPISEFLATALRYGVIVTLVGTAGLYNEWVVPLFFTSLPAAIAQALSSGQTTLSNAAFDGLIDQSVTLATAFFNATTGLSIGSSIVNGLCGIVVMCFVVLMAVSAYCVTLFAKIALALCLAVGPAFVACAMFPSTRRFAESWLGALINYVILQVLVVALLSLILSVLKTQLAQNSFPDILVQLPSVIVVCLCSFYLFHQLPAIAASLAGAGASLGIGWSARQDAAQTASAWRRVADATGASGVAARAYRAVTRKREGGSP